MKIIHQSEENRLLEKKLEKKSAHVRQIKSHVEAKAHSEGMAKANLEGMHILHVSHRGQWKIFPPVLLLS